MRTWRQEFTGRAWFFLGARVVVYAVLIMALSCVLDAVKQLW